MNKSRLIKVAGLLLVLVLQLLHHTLPHAHPVTPASSEHSITDDDHHHNGELHHHHHSHSDAQDDRNVELEGDWLSGFLTVHTHGTHSHEFIPQFSSVKQTVKNKRSTVPVADLVSFSCTEIVGDLYASTAIIPDLPLSFGTTAFYSSCPLRAPPALG